MPLVNGTTVQITQKLVLVVCSGHSNMTVLGFNQKYTCSGERHQNTECWTEFTREVVSVPLISGWRMMETGSCGGQTASLTKYSLWQHYKKNDS